MKSKSLSLSGTSLASMESLSMPLSQEVVISADIGCAECQKRLADMMSKMGEIESILVNALEKKVTIICRYPSPIVSKVNSRLVAASVYKNPLKKISLIKRILRSS